jgi:uncharacterized protein (UPF0303 family)
MSDEDILAEVRGQLGARTLAAFDHRTARRIGEAAAAVAERDGLPVVIAVQRGGQRVFHAAFEGTTAEHDDWVRRKINTALLHEVPSLEFLLRQRVSGRVPDWLEPREYAVAGGAVPIVVGGNVVGVIAVSGLVGSVRADHDLAMAALQEGASA